MKRLFAKGLVLLIAAGFLGACAEERAPIDRVQPYALPKTFFVGEDLQSVNDDPEFWTQNTLIDVGYGAAQSGLFTSTYAQPMSRIKWQITEDLLIARAAYERIEGTDGKGVSMGLETQDGIVVAVFGITSHFDIVNSYNPVTGEKMNVLEENNYDRPWYDREYIRVDWSKNMNTDSYDFDTLSMVGVYGGIAYTPLGYYVADPNDEQAPYFDMDNGYFDVTTKAFAAPGKIDLGFLGWGIDAFPACFLDADFFGGTYPTGTCNPVELTLRHSFRKVVDSDYQPVEWDGWRFQAYGGFQSTERMGYSREYGMTDSDHHRFLSRFQIWERSHYYDEPENMVGPVECYTPDTTPAGSDPNRDVDGNGTADECETVTELAGYAGSQCDNFTQKCTLPYRARSPKTLTWYYATPTDHRFFEASEIATHNWDVAMRTAVRSAQYSECVNTGGARDDCASEWPMYFGQQGANDDAIRLAMEMDDCRNGRTHQDLNGEEGACAQMVEELGEAQNAISGVTDIATMDEMIVLCHSPVEQGDHESCAAEDDRLPADTTSEMCSEARETGNVPLLEICQEALNVRRGDLRYHLVNVIEEPQTPSPWGIMTSSQDPLNGETVTSCVNVWSWVNDVWSQRLVDYMRFSAGELTAEEVTEGEFIKTWSEAADAAQRGGMLPAVTKTEYNRRISDYLGRNVNDLKVKTPLKQKAVADLRQMKQQFTGVMADSEVGSFNAPIYQARLSHLTGSELEAELMNDMVRELYGVEGMQLTDTMMDLVSPVRGGNLSIRRDMERMKQNALAERGMCEMEMAAAPVSINGLGKIIQKKFGYFNPDDSDALQIERAQRMTDYIARRAHMSVIVHEMGHTMAHRHNFVSSSDAFNYRPQYWQLRTKNGELETPGPGGMSDLIDPSGETTVGQRYFDPVSETENDNLIWMWSHSSVMEYAGEATQDFLGLGAWDFAALRMFYGDSVAVYPLDYAGPNQSGLAGYRADGIQIKLDNFGGTVGFRYNFDIDTDLHYSALNQYYDLIQDCYQVEDPTLYQLSRYDADRDGEWSPVLDGEIVSPDGQSYSRCRQQEVDYVPWRTLAPPTPEQWPTDGFGNTGYLRSATDDGENGSVVDKTGRLRVPYGFATDRWADIGNAAVYRHDNGADTYEIFNFLMTQQELFHVFDNYRRGKLTFSLRGASGRTMSRYNSKMRDGAKGLALQRNFFTQIGQQAGLAGDLYWDYAAANFFPDSIMASTAVFDHFVRTAQRPQIGPHMLPEYGADGSIKGDVLRSTEDSSYVGSEMVSIPNGAFSAEGDTFSTFSPGGKLLENQLDPTQGEYESEYTINAGSYYDKLYAALLMTESVDNFISDSRGDFVDARYRATSLADLFPEGYRRWLANNLTNDEFLKGARVATDAAGVPLVDGEGYPRYGIGYTNWWGDEPRACFPIDGTTVCGAYGSDTDLGDAPANVIPVDSQAGFEVQKFLIAWTYVYNPCRDEMGLMENDMQWWKDQLWMTQFNVVQADLLPDNQIFHADPGGRYYMAKRFGTEEIFGKTVEKGIAARVIEYANELFMQAYESVPVDIDEDGATDWYEAARNGDGVPIVKHDPGVTGILAGSTTPDPNCTPTDNSACTCEMNRSCMELKKYVAVLDWMTAWAGYADHDVWSWDDMTGIYG